MIYNGYYNNNITESSDLPPSATVFSRSSTLQPTPTINPPRQEPESYIVDMINEFMQANTRIFIKIGILR